MTHCDNNLIYKKKGIVLFTTLLLIMALLAVVMVFLNKTKEAKDNISYEFALVQTNSIMHNLVKYFDDIPFDEETIFYGSKMPFTLPFENSTVKFNIDSAHKYLNINSIAKSMVKKNNKIYDDFINMLYQYKLKDPEFFVDLLLDTIDNDNIEKNSGSGSEISLQNPTFRNGKIYNSKHLKIILDYYVAISSDNAIYNIPFPTLFSFNSPSIDINFASKELLDIIFHDADQFTLDTIKKHSKIYNSLNELPFSVIYLKDIAKGRLGHSISTSSTLIKVNVELNYKSQFKSKIQFLYDTQNKTLSDYTILNISL